MAHQMDTRGIKPQKPGTFTLLPRGRYVLEVINFEEKFSTGGDYMVVVEFGAVLNLSHKPAQPASGTIKFHNVTFMPSGKPGAGIAIHFLKCLGEPHEESQSLDIDPARWLKKRLIGDVEIEDQKERGGEIRRNPDGSPKKKNVIRSVDPLDEAALKEMDESGVPF